MRKSQIRLGIIFVLFAFCVLNLVACVEVPTRDKQAISPTSLEPQSLLKINDVPVPAGFELLSPSSYFFESGGVRVGLLKYRGKADVDRVINFYKEQMPMFNWYLLNMVEYGDRLLNFERERESCIISILPKGNNITIIISLGPKSQMPRKADRPVK